LREREVKMKAYYYLVAVLIIFGTASCGFKSSDEYNALQAKNDSLLRVQQEMEAEIEGFFSALNTIEQNIQKIKSTENTISIQPVGEEFSDDVRKKINDDLGYLNEMLRTNRDELAKLKTRLKNSAIKSAELERTITRLTKALEEETAKVFALQAQLAQRDSMIVELGNTVETIKKDVSDLKEETSRQQEKIAEQDENLHSAWYVFGTRKELREQNIVTRDGLFSANRILQGDFNKSYFVKIDLRKTKSIPLYSSRAKILTTHPKASYTLEKENGNFTLIINDTKDFWSVSRYLVIEVD